MHLICNVISIIVLYRLYIGLTIIKCNVLTCFDNSKITGTFRPKVVHCDYTVGCVVTQPTDSRLSETNSDRSLNDYVTILCGRAY